MNKSKKEKTSIETKQRSPLLQGEDMVKKDGLNSEGKFIPNDINCQKQRYISDIFHHSFSSINE